MPPAPPQLTLEQKVCVSSFVLLLQGIRIAYRDFRSSADAPSATELYTEPGQSRVPLLEAKVLRSFLGAPNSPEKLIYVTDLDRSTLYRALEYEMVFFLTLDEQATARLGRLVMRVPSAGQAAHAVYIEDISRLERAVRQRGSDFIDQSGVNRGPCRRAGEL